jgi:hypothetical protein
MLSGEAAKSGGGIIFLCLGSATQLEITARAELSGCGARRTVALQAASAPSRSLGERKAAAEITLCADVAGVQLSGDAIVGGGETVLVETVEQLLSLYKRRDHPALLRLHRHERKRIDNFRPLRRWLVKK